MKPQIDQIVGHDICLEMKSRGILLEKEGAYGRDRWNVSLRDIFNKESRRLNHELGIANVNKGKKNV